jgi:hypothetical protein
MQHGYVVGKKMQKIKVLPGIEPGLPEDTE